MKKLILLFLLFYSFAYSQVDTANWSFLPNQTNGKFTALISRELYYGISGGQYKQMSLSATSYDSTVFQLIPNQSNGRYTIIQNIVPYYGKDSGTVQMQLFNAPTTTNDTITYVKKYGAFTKEGDLTIAGTLNVNDTVATQVFRENGVLLSTKYALASGNFSVSNLDTTITGKLAKQNTWTNNNIYTSTIISYDTLKFFAPNRITDYTNIWMDSTNSSSNVLYFKSLSKTKTALVILAPLETPTGTSKGLVILQAGSNAQLYNASNGILQLGSNNALRYSINTSGHLVPLVNNVYDFGETATKLRDIYYAGQLYSALNTPPANASATGTTGNIRFGTDGYIYICTATNTWVRVQAVTW